LPGDRRLGELISPELEKVQVGARWQTKMSAALYENHARDPTKTARLHAASHLVENDGAELLVIQPDRKDS